MQRMMSGSLATMLLMLMLILSTHVNATSRKAVRQEFIYFHPSGLFSIPKPAGWVIGDAMLVGYNENSLARAGVGFVNPNDNSLIQVFIERDNANAVVNFKQLQQHFTNAYFDDAWLYYYSYKELSARTNGHDIFFEFELTDKSFRLYILRQRSFVDQGWLVTIRVIAPQHNEKLLDELEQFVTSKLAIYHEATKSPLRWKTYVDTKLGYMVKVPPDITKYTGAAGEPFGFNGGIVNSAVFVLAYAEQNTSIQSLKQAKEWVLKQNSTTKVLSIKEETRENASGYSLSFTKTDDGIRSQSGLFVLLNGKNGTLYTFRLTADIFEHDFLKPPPQQFDPFFAEAFRHALIVLPEVTTRPVSVQPALTLLPTLVPNTLTPTADIAAATAFSVQNTATALRVEFDQEIKTATSLASTRTP